MVVNPNREILHVFGRSFNSPTIYYRQLLQEKIYGKAWETVDIDIDVRTDGVHLIPFVLNRRLYLFWPIFTEKPE
jgi:hypothetical protein